MNNIPRRCYIEKMHTAELAIRNAILEVEKLPADFRLTNAVGYLLEAQEEVSNYIDKVPVIIQDPGPRQDHLMVGLALHEEDAE
jgi:hypothetical protein